MPTDTCVMKEKRLLFGFGIFVSLLLSQDADTQTSLVIHAPATMTSLATNPQGRFGSVVLSQNGTEASAIILTHQHEAMVPNRPTVTTAWIKGSFLSVRQEETPAVIDHILPSPIDHPWGFLGSSLLLEENDHDWLLVSENEEDGETPRGWGNRLFLFQISLSDRTKTDFFEMPSMGKIARSAILNLPSSDYRRRLLFLETAAENQAAHIYLYESSMLMGSDKLLRVQGFDDGKLWTLTTPLGGLTSEKQYPNNFSFYPFDWREVITPELYRGDELNRWVQQNGGFGFSSVEGGAIDPDQPNTLYMVTRGFTEQGRSGGIFRLIFSLQDMTEKKGYLQKLEGPLPRIPRSYDGIVAGENHQFLVMEKVYKEAIQRRQSLGLWLFDADKNVFEKVLEIPPQLLGSPEDGFGGAIYEGNQNWLVTININGVGYLYRLSISRNSSS